MTGSKIENIHWKQGDFLLDVPEWTLADQGITVLSGPSGSGKSSLFRILLGLEKCEGFSWIHNGCDLGKLRAPDRKIGVVLQTLELFPHMTGEENILFAARARNLEEKESRLRCEQWVQRLNLSRCISTRASNLSGGERQRVALARAIIAMPRWLFLDEPFSSLDEDLKNESRTVVKALVQEEKIPCLLITHDPRDVVELADHVTKIKNGKLIETPNLST